MLATIRTQPATPFRFFFLSPAERSWLTRGMRMRVSMEKSPPYYPPQGGGRRTEKTSPMPMIGPDPSICDLINNETTKSSPQTTPIHSTDKTDTCRDQGHIIYLLFLQAVQQKQRCKKIKVLQFVLRETRDLLYVLVC